MTMYFEMSPQLVVCTKCKREFGADLFANAIMSSGKNYKEWIKQGSLINCPHCDHLFYHIYDVQTRKTFLKEINLKEETLKTKELYVLEVFNSFSYKMSSLWKRIFN